MEEELSSAQLVLCVSLCYCHSCYKQGQRRHSCQCYHTGSSPALFLAKTVQQRLPCVSDSTTYTVLHTQQEDKTSSNQSSIKIQTTSSAKHYCHNVQAASSFSWSDRISPSTLCLTQKLHSLRGLQIIIIHTALQVASHFQ